MISSSYSGISINDSDGLIDSIKKVHTKVPLTGVKTNELLGLKDKQLQYLIAAIRNTPQIPENWSEDEWKEWITTLIPHRILPLLAKNISTWDENFRPPDFFYLQLINEFHKAAVKSLHVDYQLKLLYTEFEKENIEVIILKGGGLARSVYPDAAIRQSVDIDLIIQPEKMKSLENILINSGYLMQVPTYEISPLFYGEEEFYSSNNMQKIDLHWSIDRYYSIFDENWLEEAFLSKKLIDYKMFQFFIFHPINHLEYLAFHHIFQHDTITLDWIMDIAYLIPKLTKEDWNNIIQSSIRNNIRIPLELALISGSIWSGIRLPEQYNNFSKWPKPSEKEQKIMHHIKTYKNYPIFFLNMIHKLMHKREKLIHIYYYIFPPKGLLLKYRKSDSYLDIPCAYVRRWINIIK